MLILLIKFIHLVLALSLLGLMLYTMIITPKRYAANSLINKILLFFSLFAMLTGTLLIYPKHYTFHTPWIQAAYLLLLGFIFGVVYLIYSKKKPNLILPLAMTTLLIFIIHDAVTKTTFLF